MPVNLQRARRSCTTQEWCTCSNISTCMVYVFQHFYMYGVRVPTFLHVWCTCSNISTCMVYVFQHFYMYGVRVPTFLHVWCNVHYRVLLVWRDNSSMVVLLRSAYATFYVVRLRHLAVAVRTHAPCRCSDSYCMYTRSDSYCMYTRSDSYCMYTRSDSYCMYTRSDSYCMYTRSADLA